MHQGTDDVPNPSVTLASGEVLYADILIGADGSKSLVRDVVLEEEDAAQPGGLTVYTGVVNAENMIGDPELEPLLLADEVCHGGDVCIDVVPELLQFPIWMGEHRAFCGELP